MLCCAFAPLVVISDEKSPLLLAFVFLVVIPEGNLLSLKEGCNGWPQPSQSPSRRVGSKQYPSAAFCRCSCRCLLPLLLLLLLLLLFAFAFAFCFCFLLFAFAFCFLAFLLFAFCFLLFAFLPFCV
jgi:hypothetical protein